MLDIFIKDGHNIKEYQPKLDYIPDNKASIIQSINNLYNLNSHMILYKVIIKLIIILITTYNYIFLIYGILNRGG